MTDNRQKSNLLFWAALFVVAFLMPVVAFSLLAGTNFERRRENENRILTNIADSLAQQLQYATNNRRFWCHELDRLFSQSADVNDLNLALQILSENHSQKMSWLIWDRHGKLQVNNLNSRHTDKTWERVGRILRLASSDWWFSLSAADDTFIRSIFGPHFESKTLYRTVLRIGADLSELSHFSPVGSLWANFKDDFTTIVIFPAGIEKKAHGLRQFIKTANHSEASFALLRDDIFYSSDSFMTQQELIKLKNCLRVRAPAIDQNDRQIFTARFIDENLFLCVFRPRPDSAAPRRQSALLAMLLGFFWLLVLREYHHGRFRKGFSIKYVVSGLIVCANVFPLLILGVLGQQYLEQKRQMLIETRRIEAVNFLNRLEGEHVSETYRIKNFAIENIQTLGKTLQHEPLKEENSREFRKIMAGVAGKFMVVASTTLPAISDVAFLSREESYLLDTSGQGRLENIHYQEDNRLQLNETLCKCGAAFISFYNGTPMLDSFLAEVEIIIEGIFQSRMNNTFYKYLRLLEHVDYIGIGMERHPTFMHFLSLNSSGLADYLFMFYFNESAQAARFMLSVDSVLQGNAQGLKVVYASGKSLKNLTIRPFNEHEKLIELFTKLTYFPQPSPEFIELAGETWLAAGFISRIIDDQCLIALSPISSIDRQLNAEKQQLIVVMLLNILLVVGISLIFVQTLLRPVNRLQMATRAIRNRDFSYRVADQGKDEFGQMSRIFDSALRDLEEMSAARNVQQQLFPKQQVDTGDYDMFCKTITMADLGGDYLDVFPLDEHRFIMVLGDVAGHGVGAAMIMAMAKSAMLNSRELLDKPSELLARLHGLICRTRTKKQRKIMTFQYVMVDTAAHRVVYANAGGCNPYIVKAQAKTSTEVVLPGAALGAFKNSRFSQTEVVLEPGDTMLLYTDALVEVRNNAGEELGYDRFSDLLLADRCVGSQAYYDAIMATNRLWRQDQPRQDDLSLMILQRRFS